MHNIAILLAVLGASNILAQPIDLQKEAAIVDAQTVGKRSFTPTLCDEPIDQCLGAIKRWVDPPSTIPTNFGTECSLETCDMCPTFPGCDSSNSKSGKIPALQNWAQPPLQERDDPASENLISKQKWEQPPIENKRGAYINPILGVNVGLGPECSVHTCDMCPDYPGCENPSIA